MGNKHRKKARASRSSAKKQEPLSRRITGRRLWLFRIIAIVVIPIAVLSLTELLLRVVGYGYPAEAIIKCKVDSKDAWCDNVNFGRRFFSRNIARDTLPYNFPAKKADNTYRIFILGGSAARGTPDESFGFSRILQRILQQQYPAVNFEVLNTGMTAINSHVVLQIAKSCAEHDGDLFIIYLGNNEVVGPYGAGTVFSPLSSNLSLIRFGIAFKATKLGQMLSYLFESISTAGKTPKVWQGMRMFLDKQVRHDDPGLQTVYRHFQRNLEDIINTVGNSDTKVIVSTVGSNLKDSPPFASLHRLGLSEADEKKWADIYHEGTKYEKADKYSEAISHYLAAAEIDADYADLQFRLGRCYQEMGQYDKARQRYIQARQYDTLRFRPDTRINEIIRTVAGNRIEEGIYLVDAAGKFEDNRPHQTTGEELFYEHVHLNFSGNYLLAETIFKEVDRILPERIKRQKSNLPLLTEDQCAKDLAYTGWNRYNIAKQNLDTLIGKPPFTNQLYYNKSVGQKQQQLKALEVYLTPAAIKEVAAQYIQAINKAPRDWRLHWKYGVLLTDQLKDYKQSAEQYQLVIDLLPHFYNVYSQLAMVSLKLGDIDTAINTFKKSIRIKSNYGASQYGLALAYHRKGNLKKAVKHYSRSIWSDPSFESSHINLGAVLHKQGKTDDAIKVYRKGLTIMPASMKLHHNLIIMLQQQGRRQEAINQCRTALNIDSNQPAIRNQLRALRQQRY